ncbi:MAG: hypothetical protein AAGI72_15355 [Pseudomonadota bacterium]
MQHLGVCAFSGHKYSLACLLSENGYSCFFFEFLGLVKQGYESTNRRHCDRATLAFLIRRRSNLAMVISHFKL